MRFTLPSASSDDDGDDDDDDDELAAPNSDQCHTIVDDDGDQNYISDEWSTICDELFPRRFHAAHWSRRTVDQQSQLRDLIHNALLHIFKVAPSGPLYTSMLAIAEDKDELEEALHPLVMSVAGHSSENLSAALRIMALNNRSDSIDILLRMYKHLLRPQDAASLQFAVLIMSNSFFNRIHALSIVEEEILDVTSVFRAAIHCNFCFVDSEGNRTELLQILTLRRDSLTRRSRVSRWVKGIVTPQVETTHPMALAALMIGLPLPPGANNDDESDMLGYFELEGDEPEIEELREEFRPNIKARLTGWLDTATAIKGGPALLMKLYARIVNEMPFLKGNDLVEEMSTR